MNHGTYISIKPTIWTRGALKRFCNDLHINMIDEEQLHCTIVYSEDVTLKEDVTCPDLYSGYDFSFECWHNGVENTTMLVLRFNSPCIQKRHNDLNKLYGFVHTHPHYNMHITLTGDLGPGSNCPDLKDLNFQINEYIYKLSFEREVQEYLDIN